MKYSRSQVKNHSTRARTLTLLRKRHKVRIKVQSIISPILHSSEAWSDCEWAAFLVFVQGPTGVSDLVWTCDLLCWEVIAFDVRKGDVRSGQMVKPYLLSERYIFVLFCSRSFIILCPRWKLSQTFYGYPPTNDSGLLKPLVYVLASCIAHTRSADRYDKIKEVDCIDACYYECERIEALGWKGR